MDDMDVCMYVWMDVWMYGCMYVCMYGCMYGCMDGWMDGWIDDSTCRVLRSSSATHCTNIASNVATTIVSMTS